MTVPRARPLVGDRPGGSIHRARPGARARGRSSRYYAPLATRTSASPVRMPALMMTEATLPRWRVFPALGLGVVMATLDISVVNIALPTLSRAFRVPLTTVEW